jgi:hypothetical protein
MTDADAPHADRPPPKKTRWWLVLLVLFGMVVGGIVLVVGGFAWWIHANKDRLAGMAREADTASTEFAASHDQDACVGEGLKKSEACDGIMCEASAKLFVERCIPKASPSPGFCDGVPSSGEIMKTVSWIQDECKKRGKPSDDQKCQRLMQAVPPACHKP